MSFSPRVSLPCSWVRMAFLLGLSVASVGCGGGSSSASASIDEDDHTDEGAAGESPVVHLDADAIALGGVEVGRASEVPSSALVVTGSITFDQDRVSQVGPKTPGRVVELSVAVGSDVVHGQTLAHLESPEVGETRASLSEAEALVSIAEENYTRERRLEEQGISSRRELLDAEADLRRAEASLESARERLRVLGADAHGDGGHFDIVSPYAGRVVAREAGLGEVIGTEDAPFTVADLSRLWLELDIYERDLRSIVEGQDVAVTTPAWPDRVFAGRIVYIGDLIDTERRTVPARVELDNTDRALKPGMFATARISSPGAPPVVAVPRDAVQDVEGAQVVWVPGDEADEFEAHPVVLGRDLLDGMVEIVSGLAPGDRLVILGAFTLKAELSRGEFGGHGH